MPAISSSVKALADSLIRYGVIDSKAVDIAKKTTKAFPNLSNTANRMDFITMVKAVNDNAPYQTLREGRARANQTRAGLPQYSEKQIRIGTPDNYYIAYTTLPPKFVNSLLVGIMKDWIDFATGRDTLGGKRLKHTTGSYASSITSSQMGNYFTIFSDSPYADTLESGLRKKTLKRYVGNFGPNHDGEYVNVPIGNRALISSKTFPSAQIVLNQVSKRMRATTRVSNATINNRFALKFTGGAGEKFRHLDAKSSAAWVLPSYHPALQLWRKLSQELRFVGRLLK